MRKKLCNRDWFFLSAPEAPKNSEALKKGSNFEFLTLKYA